MLKVRTRIGKSGIHGTGLFADQFIPKNTITWEYTPGLDIDLTKETVDSLNPLQKQYILYYSYFDNNRGKYILCSDNQRFINHTTQKDKENVLSTPDKDIAFRDIQIGEELLCDYNKFDSEYFKRMNINPEKLI